jgi:thioredoxin reductase
MSGRNNFDVILVGGSYSGLAAALAIGRSLKKALIIDDASPCNRQTPHSHNFITNDGRKPQGIAELAKQQLQQYETVQFFNGKATVCLKTENGFQTTVSSGETFLSKKLIFATGVKDLLPPIQGIDACWGVSVLHCPYCHGYEVRDQITGILINSEQAYDFTRLISNWTRNLTIFTNGATTLTTEQTLSLSKRKIDVVQKEVIEIVNKSALLEKLIFKDGSDFTLSVLYAPANFEQHCKIPQYLGCELSSDGYIKVDAFQETSVKGIYACGDNTTKLRTLANAVASGTTAGMSLTKAMILEEF